MTVAMSRRTLAEAERAYATAATGRDLTEAREWLTVARASHYRDCVDVVERLGVLLEPFADEAQGWHERCKDEWLPIIGSIPGDAGNAAFTVGDLRAIAKLYEEVK